jgi:hypothetical protein
MNTTMTDMRSFQAPVGTAARSARWLATAAAFGSHHELAVIKPMPSSYVVENTKGIRHRPPEDSS